MPSSCRTRYAFSLRLFLSRHMDPDCSIIFISFIRVTYLWIHPLLTSYVYLSLYPRLVQSPHNTKLTTVRCFRNLSVLACWRIRILFVCEAWGLKTRSDCGTLYGLFERKEVGVWFGIKIYLAGYNFVYVRTQSWK